MELQTAVKWSNDYIPKGDSVRVNRPIYHFSAHILGRIINIPLSLFIKDKNLNLNEKYLNKIRGRPTSLYASVFIACLIINFIMYVLSLVINYKIINGVVANREVAEFSTILLATSPLFILNARQIHTNLYGIFLNFVLYYLMYKFIYETKSFRSFNTFFMITIGVGFLLLGKAHFTLYVLLIGLIFLKRGIVKASSFLLFSSLPWILWIVICRILGIKYFNYEWEHYEQGKWIFTIFFHLRFWQAVQKLFNDLSRNLILILDTYTPLTLLTYCYFWLDKKFYLKLKVFTLVAIIIELLFLFAIKRSHPLYLASLSIIFYPLITFYFLKIFRKFNINNNFFYLIIFLNLLLLFR